MADERAVTVPTNYVIMLAIVTILSSGLFATTAGFVETQQEQALRGGLDVSGNRLANDLATADRLGATATAPGTVEITVDLPATVAGSTYRIEIEPVGDRTRLTLTSARPAVSVSLAVRTTHPVVATTVSGGPLVVVFDPATDRLEVHHG